MCGPYVYSTIYPLLPLLWILVLRLFMVEKNLEMWLACTVPSILGSEHEEDRGTCVDQQTLLMTNLPVPGVWSACAP